MLEDLRKNIRAGLVNRTLSKASRWASHRVWLPKPYEGFMQYDKFPWLREILDIEHGTVSVRKGSQLGFSIAAIAKSLHLVCEKGEDVMYILPTKALVSDFSMGRLDPILAMSEELRNGWRTANVGFRQWGNNRSSWYIRGSKSEADIVSVPLGYAVIDEYDRCCRHTMPMIMKRFSARENFFILNISTPTLPEHGIDEIYQQGSQELFMFPCPSCSKTIYLKWPDSVEICGDHHQSADCSRSYFKCFECGAQLPHQLKHDWLKKAQWVPSVAVDGHRSFSINQMYSPGMSAEDIVREYLRGELSEQVRIQFMNQTIGLPYIMQGGRLTLPLITACIENHSKDDERPENARRMICMGVDVGTFLDVVVVEFIYDNDPGNEPHLNSIAKVLWEGRLPGTDWAGLDRMMHEWQVHHCCIDMQPETTKAKEFCRRFPGSASLVQYRKGTSGWSIKSSTEENGVVIHTVCRTSFLDLALGRVHKGRILLPRDISETWKDHVQALVRTYELGEDGNPVAVYVGNSDDHQAHALAFAEVAHFQAYSRSTGRTIRPGENVF